MTSRRASTLHLQLGQETVYLILAIAVFVALLLASRQHEEQRREPPIIRMKEADGFYFPTGSATISPPFARKLNEQIVPLVQRIGRDAKAQVVEVIGHTDAVPLALRGRKATNLDRTLMPEFSGTPGDVPQAADNVGLGMARAVAVARVLRAAPLLRGFQIMPMSAGAFQRTDDTMAEGSTARDEQERRRIVIRVRRRVIG